MICFIDFETTGVDVFRDEPIDFGAVLVDKKLKVLKRFSSRMSINKSVYLTKRAISVHNITAEELEGEPNPRDVINKYFSEFGTEYRLCGWNISFDVTFLRKLCHKNGMMVKYNMINHRHIDIQSLGFLINELDIVNVNNVSLDDWIKYFGLSRSKNHSAVEDAELSYKIYCELLGLFRRNL